MADQDALVPDPLVSDRQYERFHNLDIADLDDTELTDELNHLRPLLWGLDSQHWLRKRVEMILTELRKRQGENMRQFTRQSKPAKPKELKAIGG